MSAFRCLLCDEAAATEPVADGVRDGRSGEPAVVRCSACGLIQLFPLPPPEEEAAFYRADGQARSLVPETDLALWRAKGAADTARRVAWLRRVQPEPAAVLDVGCGYGFFVDDLARLGYDATGIDLSTERHRWATSRHAGTFLEGVVDDAFARAAAGRYRVVTAFHVLEHLRDPVAFLRRCHALLAPGGRLLIEVPNAADELLGVSPPYRAFYWQRAHLTYFDPERLDLLLRRADVGPAATAGAQRYGLRNAIWWLDQGKPFLGVESTAGGAFHERLDRLYRVDREKDLRCDTLTAEIRKPEGRTP